MAEEEDKDPSGQTEEPTQRRLEKAIEEGQIIYSKEVSNFLVFLSLIFMVVSILPEIVKSSMRNLIYYIRNFQDIYINEKLAEKLFRDNILGIIKILGLPFLIFFLVGAVSLYIQNNRISFNPKLLMPKLDNLSPLKGFKKIFSMKSIVEFIKNIAKVILVGISCYIVMLSTSKKYKLLHDYEMSYIIAFLYQSVKDILIAASIIMFFIALFDYIYQRFNFYSQVKMSKQELKEEYKETEGSPEIKSKLKQMRAEKAKKRMMSNIPTADVIITNPTHYAIALKYDQEKMNAPMLVAKGIDHVALNIRKIAIKNDVPIIENPPLARELYKKVDIDEEIPLEYYQAVAEIISYVYSLKKSV